MSDTKKTKKTKKPSSQTTVASRLAHNINNTEVMKKIAKRNYNNSVRANRNITRDIK